MTENELKRCRAEFESWVLNNFSIKPSQYTDDDVADFMKYRWNTWQAGYVHQSALLAKAVEALGMIAATEKLTWAELEKLPYNWDIAKQTIAEINKGD